MHSRMSEESTFITSKWTPYSHTWIRTYMGFSILRTLGRVLYSRCLGLSHANTTLMSWCYHWLTLFGAAWKYPRMIMCFARFSLMSSLHQGWTARKSGHPFSVEKSFEIVTLIPLPPPPTRTFINQTRRESLFHLRLTAGNVNLITLLILCQGRKVTMPIFTSHEHNCRIA